MLVGIRIDSKTSALGSRYRAIACRNSAVDLVSRARVTQDPRSSVNPASLVKSIARARFICSHVVMGIVGVPAIMRPSLAKAKNSDRESPSSSSANALASG